jgi:hydrogenase maturation protease
MKPIVVIGVGSSFGYDRLGREVIELLRSRARTAPSAWRDVSLVHNDRLGAPLLAQMRGVRAAILVDALDSAAGPDEIVRIGVDATEAPAAGLSSHGFGLAQTLAVGRRLSELPPRVVILALPHGGQPARVPGAPEIIRLADAVCSEIARLTGDDACSISNPSAVKLSGKGSNRE